MKGGISNARRPKATTKAGGTKPIKNTANEL